jgi:hypothetical protein
MPAAGERVAVAALQLPMARRPPLEWQGLRIIVELPERRLFAYELATGCPLWNHAPPLDWDGGSGPHEQRMTLIGSPTVVGERVLVACTSDLSSIDYHVTCYQLATGAFSWSTFVVRGQVERNMYAMLVAEFPGPPLVAVPERGRVIAQTGLGQIAALDLATGEVLWRSEYQTIELPKTRSYTPPRREVVWRMNPPVVVGDVVLATPPDSRELIALDLENGALLWSVSSRKLRELDKETELLGFDQLIAADADGFLLGGAKLSAFAMRRGLGLAQKPEPLWTVRLEHPETLGRGHLLGDFVVVPGPTECLAFDRRTGSWSYFGTDKVPFPEVKGTRGMLVTDEALFALTEDGLTRVAR